MAPAASNFLQGVLPVASLLPGLLLRSSPAAALSAFGGTRATLQVKPRLGCQPRTWLDTQAMIHRCKHLAIPWTIPGVLSPQSRNKSTASTPPPFNFTEILPQPNKQTVPYRLLTKDHVTPLKLGDQTFLKVRRFLVTTLWTPRHD
jgi:hypothetical protein